MKWFSTAFALSGLGLALVHSNRGSQVQNPQTPPDARRLLILGNHRGYLNPCGCSEPMLGGILRQASLVRRLESDAPTAVIDSGNLTAGDGTQELMKAETLVETLANLQVAAIALTPSEMKMDLGHLANLVRLSKGAFTSADVANAELAVDPFKSAGKFLIVSVGSPSVLSGTALENLSIAARSASARQMTEVALVNGTHSEALQFCRRFPEFAVVVYRSDAAPGVLGETVGKTVLVSPGERGEYLVELDLNSTGDLSYRRLTLSPEIADDSTASRFYRAYLRRVDQDPALWDQRPRLSGPAYAGSAACAKCHAGDYVKWKSGFWATSEGHSSHSKALRTLLDRGHGKDPECLPCHVTGSEWTSGFHSQERDPQLSFVGCESCHGPAALHAANPQKVRLPTWTRQGWERRCTTCHSPLNSPNFDFPVYWARIQHGSGENRWKSKK